jgi:hypothetical protein
MDEAHSGVLRERFRESAGGAGTEYSPNFQLGSPGQYVEIRLSQGITAEGDEKNVACVDEGRERGDEKAKSADGDRYAHRAPQKAAFQRTVRARSNPNCPQDANSER